MARRKAGGDGRQNRTTVKPTDDNATAENQGEKETIYEAQAIEETTSEQQAPTIEDFVAADEFEIPSEQPKKRGRKAGGKNRRRVDTSQTTQFITSLVDVLGVSLAGSEGQLTDTERTLLTLSLDEVGTRYGAQVEKYAGYMYPVCGVAAVVMWGKRVLDLRQKQNEEKSNSQAQQSDSTQFSTTGASVTTDNGSNVQGSIFSDSTLAQGINNPF
jgi:hypothetical protein